MIGVHHHYLPNDDWCDSGFSPPAPNPFSDAINVYFVENCNDWINGTCSPCYGGLYNGGQKVFITRQWFRYTCGSWWCDVPDEQAADVLIHEIGHLLGLAHSFANDGCADTYQVSNFYNTNNFMDWNPCRKGSFTCCQLEKMHSRLDANPIPPYVMRDEPCEADFTIAQTQCNFTLTSTSTPSTGGDIINTEWCIENKVTGENTRANGTSYTLQSPDNGAYQVCICIEDSNGCEDVVCQDLEVDCEDPCEDPRNIPAPVFDNYYFFCEGDIIGIINANVPQGVTVSNVECLNCGSMNLFSNDPVTGGPIQIRLSKLRVGFYRICYDISNELCSTRYCFTVEIYPYNNHEIPCQFFFGEQTDEVEAHQKRRDQKFELSPNPSTGVVNLQSQNFISDGQVQVYDSSGKLLRQLPLTDSLQHTLDLSDLDSGLYFIEVRNAEGSIYVEKLLLE